MRVRVVGLYYRKREAQKQEDFETVQRLIDAESLAEGSRFTLEREPDNKYDGYAIKVIWNDLHIGYIPSPKAQYIAPIMDESGEPSEAVLVEYEVERKTLYPVVEISIDEDDLE